MTTAAVMGISTDSEERLLDSAGGHRVSEAPTGHPERHRALCSSLAPQGCLMETERQEGIMHAFRPSSPKNIMHEASCSECCRS